MRDGVTALIIVRATGSTEASLTVVFNRERKSRGPKKMDIDPDAIAAAVISEFEKLPSKRKPHIRSNGVHEWVPLSGIVARGATGSFRSSRQL